MKVQIQEFDGSKYEAVNPNSNNADTLDNYHAEDLLRKSFENSDYKVGDIITTVRNDLGEKWIECNRQDASGNNELYSLLDEPKKPLGNNSKGAVSAENFDFITSKYLILSYNFDYSNKKIVFSYCSPKSPDEKLTATFTFYDSTLDFNQDSFINFFENTSIYYFILRGNNDIFLFSCNSWRRPLTIVSSNSINMHYPSSIYQKIPMNVYNNEYYFGYLEYNYSVKKKQAFLTKIDLTTGQQTVFPALVTLENATSSSTVNNDTVLYLNGNHFIMCSKDSSSNYFYYQAGIISGNSIEIIDESYNNDEKFNEGVITVGKDIGFYEVMAVNSKNDDSTVKIDFKNKKTTVESNNLHYFSNINDSFFLGNNSSNAVWTENGTTINTSTEEAIYQAFYVDNYIIGATKWEYYYPSQYKIFSYNKKIPSISRDSTNQAKSYIKINS